MACNFAFLGLDIREPTLRCAISVSGDNLPSAALPLFLLLQWVIVIALWWLWLFSDYTLCFMICNNRIPQYLVKSVKCVYSFSDAILKYIAFLKSELQVISASYWGSETVKLGRNHWRTPLTLAQKSTYNSFK